MERKETNAWFVNLVNGNDAIPHLLIDAARFTGRCSADSVEDVKNYINERFSKDENSWAIDEIRKEYNHIAGLSTNNYRLWAKYRENKSQYPVQNPNGDYVECKLECLSMNIGGQRVNVYPDADIFGINVFSDGQDEIFINLTMVQKILQIKEQLKEYRRLFE